MGIFALHDIPLLVPTTPLHDMAIFALHDIPLLVPTTPLHDMVIFALHDIPLLVPTTPLHDMGVFALHDMAVGPHDTAPRHAPQDMVLPRHGKMHSTTCTPPCRGDMGTHVVDAFTMSY